MKVFRVDEEHWYAGKDWADAIAAYLRDIGFEGIEYVQEYGEPDEIPDADLDRMIVTDVDEPGQPKQTFREALAQRKDAGFIATTCY